jgi:hypothetical protein
MTVQEFVNIDKDLQTVQDISDVNIIKAIESFRNIINEVFETLCFNFCAICEKKLKYLDKDEEND